MRRDLVRCVDVKMKEEEEVVVVGGSWALSMGGLRAKSTSSCRAVTNARFPLSLFGKSRPQHGQHGWASRVAVRHSLKLR